MNASTHESPEFFQMACAATVRHAVDALRLGGRKIRPGNVLLMLTTAPRDWDEVSSLDHHEDSFCRQCLSDAYRRIETPEDRALFEDARHHFMSVLPYMSAQTRRLLEAAIKGVIPGLELAVQWDTGRRLKAEDRDSRDFWCEAVT